MLFRSDEAAAREAEEKAREEERVRRREEAEVKEREQREAEERAKAKAEEKERERKAEEEAARLAAAAQPAPEDSTTAPRAAQKQAPRRQEPEREQKNRGRGKGRDDGRRSGKLKLNQALAGGEGGRQKSLAAMKRKQERARQKAMGGSQDREKVVRDVQLPEMITVAELANRMAERVGDVVKSLMNSGVMATQNQTIDADTAELIIEEIGRASCRERV
mgnify:CR=1 FL=1